MVRELRGHVGAVHAVIFNRDGTNIISGGVDGCLRVWDVSKIACLIALNLRSGPLNSIAASRDGSILATGTEATTGDQKGASIQVEPSSPFFNAPHPPPSLPLPRFGQQYPFPAWRRCLPKDQ